MCVTHVQKNFQIRTRIKQLLTNIKFSWNCPKFHIFTWIVIFQVYLQLLNQLLYSYKFHGKDMPGILFFIFASCEPLIQHAHKISIQDSPCFYTMHLSTFLLQKHYFSPQNNSHTFTYIQLIKIKYWVTTFQLQVPDTFSISKVLFCPRTTVTLPCIGDKFT